jgi:DNA (cytosine-5)-methyltransferase 1
VDHLEKREKRYWPTPRASGQENPESLIKRKGLRKAAKHNLTCAVKMWPTPRVSDTEGGIVQNVDFQNGNFSRRNIKGERWGVKLKDAVNHTEKLWPTPRAGNPGSRKPGTGGKILGEEVKRGSENGGQLNPTWVEWLMGFEAGWTDLSS